MADKKAFIHDDFLLETEFASNLYHNYSAKQPIIDYHCHLSPELIAKDYQFNNITEIWIDGDHYKWRAMRTLGVDERFITGDASPKEKFIQWASCVPKLIRNPLYHWTHLELKRYFDIDELLTADNAAEIYDKTSELLQLPEYSVLSLLKKMGVETVCTTEDPLDSLAYHSEFTHSDGITLSTAFRPDKAIEIQSEGFENYMEQLSAVVGFPIHSFESLTQALDNRMDYFATHGCVLSDHGLEQIRYAETNDIKADEVFQKKRNGKPLTATDLDQYKTAVLLFLAKGYHKRGWVQQYHLGALRNNNKRMLQELGPDTGWDSIGDFNQAVGLSLFFDTLDKSDQLTKTIIYNLNPSDNELFATMIGNFNDGSIRGKMQFGSGWWFLDQLDGMTKQINALSNMGVLSVFVGMLTDSRSFMSFPRHEYFRRLLCNILGNDVKMGHLPNNIEHLGAIVSDICYHNAKSYFNFNQ
jgi:glucuronate isomerase